MATDVEDTRQLSRVSGSGLYGVDTASVKGDKISESPVHDDNEEIRRLSAEGFNFSGSRRNGWEDIVIWRASRRKVAIQLLEVLNSPPDREKEPSLIIDLDHAVLIPVYMNGANLRCHIRKHEKATAYILRFKTRLDIFKFQEVTTGFRVQTHIRDVHMRLGPLPTNRTDTTDFHGIIQLWRKVPNQYQSLVRTHDSPRTESHLPKTGAKGGSPERGDFSTQLDTTTASNMGPGSVDGPVMKKYASSLLVFSGNLPRTAALIDRQLISLPLDGRISIDTQCRCGRSKGSCQHITLVEDRAKTSSILANRSSATIWGAVWSSTLRLTDMGSDFQASRLSEADTTISQELQRVELEFKTVEDKKGFEAAFDALKPQHGPHFGEEKLHPNYQSSKEQGSLTRKYESAAADAGFMIPTLVRKGVNTEITPFYKAKAEKGGSLTPVPPFPRALAGHSSSHIGERPDNLAFTGGRLNPKIELDNRKRSSNVSDDRQRELVRSSIGKTIGDVDPNLRLIDKSPRLIYLQCPFHFLGCREMFRICRERLWITHSLTHFQIRKARSYGDLVRRIEPPKCCRCYICKNNFSSLSGTACWNDYMNHFRHCGLGHERVPPDSTLIEYLWQKGILSLATYRGLDVPPPATLIESESSASIVSETSKDEKQGSRFEIQVNRKVQRASIETSAEQEQRRRRICQKMIIFTGWKREQDVSIPDELWSSPTSFEFINVLEMSTFDKIKGLFETYSGREWNWWPFSAPAKPLEMGKVRIRWQCACGDQRWTDASKYLSRKCQALVNENTTAGHERGNATSQSASSAASHSQSGSVVPGSFPSDTSKSIGDTSNICPEAQASHNQTTYENSSSKDLYVLFCIYQQSQILHSQILATKCQNDEAFFENLRREYRLLRGFFRFWFSPFQFSHCDFVKFTRFYVN